MPVLSMFLKEVMRMYSPVPAISRMLTKPTVLDGITFPEGVQIGVNMMGINHHPDVWQDHNVIIEIIISNITI